MMERHQFIEAVGIAPENLVFLGQYFDAGVASTTPCAATKNVIRFCFVLKTADGKQKITIGTDAFPPFKFHNPKVAHALEAAYTLLLVTAEAEEFEIQKRAKLQAEKTAAILRRQRPRAILIAPSKWKVKVGRRKREAQSLDEVIRVAYELKYDLRSVKK